MPEALEQFMQLFVGGDQSHGVWTEIRGHEKGGKGHTEHRAPTPEHYRAHLEGRVGLGLVPVQRSGLCRFAAIDIDIDTIDHKQLYAEVKGRNLPLTVCRSKSGGAHLYLFAPAPGLPAALVRETLKRWATVLGYPAAEIFPKQSKIGPENFGNWINLPYYGGDATTRYAVGPGGALGLSEFFQQVTFFTGNASQVDEAPSAGTADMPPCLATLTRNGIGQGHRNTALFNFAIFYRKAQPANWETHVNNHNIQYFQPPLEFREVQGLVNSMSRTKYQYQCDQAPLRDLCNREVCVKLPFGVGNKPWDEVDAFDDFVVGHCRKILTDPPRYLVEVNGHDLAMEWEQLYSYQQFKSFVGRQLNIVVPGMKQPQWEMRLRKLLTEREEIDAPEDASLAGLVLERFHEFLSLRERAQNKEDILRGIPVQDGGVVLFRVGDFRRYLQGYKLDRIEGNELYDALRRDGCTFKRIRVNGRLITVWAYPTDKVNDQTTEFAIPDFKRDFGEDM